MKYPFIAGLAAATVLTCSSVTEPPQVAIGIIEWVEGEVAAQPALETGMLQAEEPDYGLPVLEAPDTVTAGKPFQILVWTWGPSPCWRATGAEVLAMAGAIQVTPYDELPDPDALCLGVMVRLERTIELTFADPGEGVIKITGRRVIRGEEMVEEDAQIEHTIVVLPPSGS